MKDWKEVSNWIIKVMKGEEKIKGMDEMRKIDDEASEELKNVSTDLVWAKVKEVMNMDILHENSFRVFEYLPKLWRVYQECGMMYVNTVE